MSEAEAKPRKRGPKESSLMGEKKRRRPPKAAAEFGVEPAEVPKFKTSRVAARAKATDPEKEWWRRQVPDPMTGLTPAEENFVVHIHVGVTQLDAFLMSFPHAVGWKKESVWSKACALANSEKVARRLAFYRERDRPKVEYSKEQAFEDVDKAITLATTTVNAPALVSALKLKAQIAGLLVQKVEVSKDPFTVLLEKMSPEEARSVLAVLEGRVIDATPQRIEEKNGVDGQLGVPGDPGAAG